MLTIKLLRYWFTYYQKFNNSNLGILRFYRKILKSFYPEQLCYSLAVGSFILLSLTTVQ